MPFRPEDYTDDQEVVRTIGDLKIMKGTSYWTGFLSGIAFIAVTLFLLFTIGLKYDI